MMSIYSLYNNAIERAYCLDSVELQQYSSSTPTARARSASATFYRHDRHELYISLLTR